jgi:hypothetical protein
MCILLLFSEIMSLCHKLDSDLVGLEVLGPGHVINTNLTKLFGIKHVSSYLSCLGDSSVAIHALFIG